MKIHSIIIGLVCVFDYSANAQNAVSQRSVPLLNIIPGKELEIQPSATSSATDFDFFYGKWDVVNHKLAKRLVNSSEWFDFTATNTVDQILKGQGNTDIYVAVVDRKPFEGMTLRLFDPKTRLWHIFWADSNTGQLSKPLVGSFDGRIGTFYDRDIYNGRQVLVKFIWDKSDLEHPVWSQAFSPDEGKTWEWNWYMNFKRPAPLPEKITH